MLAGFFWTGVNVFSTVRWLAIILFGINLILVGLIGREITRSTWAGLFTMVLFLASEPFLNFHTFALTEPVFLCLFFLSLLTLFRFLEGKKIGWILLTGFLISLLYLTRYIGIALLGTALVCIWVFIPKLKDKLVNSLWLIVGFAPAVAAWSVRNYLLTASVTNRQSMWHAIPTVKIQDGVSNFWNWLLLERFGLLERFYPILQWILYLGIGAFLLVVAIKGLQYLSRKTRPEMPSSKAWVLAVTAAIYFLLVIFTLLYLDASINLEPRILMPIYNLLLFLLVYTAYILWQKPTWIARLVIVLFFGVLMISFAEDLKDTIQLNRSQGQGFANDSWVESQTIAELANHQDQLIYTNRIRAVNLFLERGAYIIPSPLNPSTGKEWADYRPNVKMIRESVLQGKSVIAVFGYDDILLEADGREWMKDITEDLPVLGTYADGKVFGTQR